LPGGASQSPDQFIPQRIIFCASDLFDQAGQAQLTFMTIDQRRLVFEVFVRVTKLKNQRMSFGYVRREVTIADFSSSKIGISVNDLAKDIIGGKIRADQKSRNMINILPDQR